MQITTKSERETFNFAKKYAKKLKAGIVIGLIGELGAGKTVFVKGLATGLGIKKTITSPTFVIMKIYKTTRAKRTQITDLCHIDAYRLKSAKELQALGVEEYFYQPDTVTIIEWADRVKKILPKTAKFVRIKNKGKNKRLLTY
ncbi:MAG: tRNA (adenosine(37)-N6)-threonylcarbamoyltransferase complex ATPase subunit type 1 TsaE [Patescibacteria group bacterium]